LTPKQFEMLPVWKTKTSSKYQSMKKFVSE